MAALAGHKLVGHKKTRPWWGEKLPIDCLDGCRCGGKKHKKIDMCSCKKDWVCATCAPLIQAYPQENLFTNDSVFTKFK